MQHIQNLVKKMFSGYADVARYRYDARLQHEAATVRDILLCNFCTCSWSAHLRPGSVHMQGVVYRSTSPMGLNMRVRFQWQAHVRVHYAYFSLTCAEEWWTADARVWDALANSRPLPQAESSGARLYYAARILWTRRSKADGLVLFCWRFTL